MSANRANTFTYRAQRSTGTNIPALEQLYSALEAALQPRIHVPSDVLDDIIDASQLEARELIDVAQRHYESAKALYKEASDEQIFRIDDDDIPFCNHGRSILDRQPDITLEDDVQDEPLQEDNGPQDGPVPPALGGEGEGQQRQPSLPISPIQRTAERPSALPPRPDLPIADLVKQFFQQKPDRIVTSFEIYTFVAANKSNIGSWNGLKSTVRDALSEGEDVIYENGVDKRWR
ncbi:hypothetical protein CLAFUW4_07688 [Fulvia fulva]|nr:hypothetical protein CLAFUR4_07693 [Fulvia fulva]WPV12952.1 hypothetical protein CLAFUW4_07688 [Fulvia fulva]